MKVYMKTKSSTDLDNSVSTLDGDGYGDADNSVFVRSCVFSCIGSDHSFIL